LQRIFALFDRVDTEDYDLAIRSMNCLNMCSHLPRGCPRAIAGSPFHI